MQQIFSELLLETGMEFALHEADYHHLIKVLRMRSGESVRIVDAKQNVFIGELDCKKKTCSVFVTERLKEKRELTLPIDLYMSRIRKEHWELILQKATEIGIDTFVPLRTARTVVRDGNFEKNKLTRWKKIIQEAAQQSERHRIPEFADEVEFGQLPQKFQEENTLVFFCCERNDENPVFFVLSNLISDLTGGSLKEIKRIAVVIGPEGGFHPEEIELAEKSGWRFISLGSRILRAETAAIVATGIVAQYVEMLFR